MASDNVTPEFELTLKRPKLNHIIVDVHNLMYRIFPSIDVSKTFESEEKKAIFMVRELLLKLINLRNFYGATLHICWEGSDNFRYKLYPEYKGKRDRGTDLSVNVTLVKGILRDVLLYCDVDQWDGSECEGDDIMATLAHQLHGNVAIYSSDRDFLQLLFENENTKLYSCIPRKSKSDLIIDADDHIRAFGFYPEDRIFIKSLEGDVGDNIQGAKGIGRNTAIELLKAYSSIDNLYNKIKTVPAKSQFETKKQYTDRLKALALSEAKLRALIQYEESVRLSYELGKIKLDANIFKLPNRKIIGLKTLLEQYGWEYYTCKTIFSLEDGDDAIFELPFQEK